MRLTNVHLNGEEFHHLVNRSVVLLTDGRVIILDSISTMVYLALKDNTSMIIDVDALSSDVYDSLKENGDDIPPFDIIKRDVELLIKNFKDSAIIQYDLV